jgi:hypothetical protein
MRMKLKDILKIIEWECKVDQTNLVYSWFACQILIGIPLKQGQKNAMLVLKQYVKFIMHKWKITFTS